MSPDLPGSSGVCLGVPSHASGGECGRPAAPCRWVQPVAGLSLRSQYACTSTRTCNVCTYICARTCQPHGPADRHTRHSHDQHQQPPPAPASGWSRWRSTVRGMDPSCSRAVQAAQRLLLGPSLPSCWHQA